MKIGTKQDLVIGENGKIFSKEINAIVGELEKVIESSGITLSDTDNEQLFESITKLSKDSSITDITQSSDGNTIIISRDYSINENTIIWFIPTVMNTGDLSISLENVVLPAYDFTDTSLRIESNSLSLGSLYLGIKSNTKWLISSATPKQKCVLVSQNRDPLITDNKCALNAVWTNTTTGNKYTLINLDPINWKLTTSNVIPTCLLFNVGNGFNVNDKIMFDGGEFIMYEDCNWALLSNTEPNRTFDDAYIPTSMTTTLSLGDKIVSIPDNDVWTSLDMRSGNAVWGTPNKLVTVLNDAIPTNLIKISGLKENDLWYVDNGEKLIATNTLFKYTHTDLVPNSIYDTTKGYVVGDTITGVSNTVVRRAIDISMNSAIWAIIYDRDPLATDDGPSGHAIGDYWYNSTSGITFIANNVSVGNAVWSNINLTPSPTLSTNVITLVESHSDTINITNYDASNTYIISSSNTDNVFAAVNGSVITIVSYSVLANLSETLVLISDSVNESPSTPTTITVNVTNVSGISDDIIINNNYQANASQNDGFVY